MNVDDDLVVEVPDDKSVVADDQIPDIAIADPASKPATETVDDGIEALKKQLEDEKSGRAAAETRAREASDREREAAERATKATTEARDSNLNLVTGAIERLKQSAELLEERFEQAAAAGDYKAMAKVQSAMSENAVQRSQLEAGKQAMETAPKDTPVQRRSSDPVEELASAMQSNGSPRSAEWIRAHPEYVRDANLNRRMLAAHNLAVSDGIAADTDAYFDAIETTLRLREHAADPAPRQRNTPPPAAPSSRAAATNGSGPKNSIRLSSDEVEMAEMMGMTVEEYARNKIALQKDGRLN